MEQGGGNSSDSDCIPVSYKHLHFLYNTLSVISASADQQEKVERMCSRLSDMLRYSTVYEEESNSTLEDEVRHTENYLELMKDRYEENLI